jgi:hypothetical protein
MDASLTYTRGDQQYRCVLDGSIIRHEMFKDGRFTPSGETAPLPSKESARQQFEQMRRNETARHA